MKPPDEDRFADPSPELERLLRGELTADSPEARRLFAENPVLAEEFESILELQRRLDAAGLHEAKDLGALEPTEEQVDATRNTLSSLWDAEDHRGEQSDRGEPDGSTLRLPRWAWAVGMAAAACIVLALWWARHEPAPPGSTEQPFLGIEGQGIQLVEPLGEVDQVDLFLWQSEMNLQSDQSYTLTIRSDVGTVVRVTDLKTTEYRLTTKDRDKLADPSTLRWQVSLHDAFHTKTLPSSETQEVHVRDR